MSIFLCALGAGVLLLAGCSSSGGGSASAAGGGTASGGTKTWAQVEAAAKQEGSLVFYSTSSDMTDALTKGFEKAYPWVKVESVNASAGTIASRAITEAKAGSKTADVIIDPRGNQVALEQANAVVKSQVPNDAQMTKRFADPSYMSHPIYVTPTTLTYNTDKLTPAELPKNIYDLADPKWKGKIGFDRPSNMATSAGFFATQKAVMGTAKWMQWLQGIKANQPFITSDSTSAYEALVRGDLEVVVDGPNDVIDQPKGTPAAFATYDDMASFVQSMWLTRGASHPDVGLLFINWVISPAGQLVLASTGRSPALQTVTSPVSLSQLLPKSTTYAPANALNDFYSDPSYYQNLYASLWPND